MPTCPRRGRLATEESSSAHGPRVGPPFGSEPPAAAASSTLDRRRPPDAASAYARARAGRIAARTHPASQTVQAKHKTDVEK
jgi:hypothetical protein